MYANQMLKSLTTVVKTGAVALALCLSGPSHALVEGWEGTVSTGPTGTTVHEYVLTARDDFISTSDGSSHYTWGYAHGTSFAMQYPGPTLVVNQGDTVSITLNNTLPVPVSIVFPGQKDVIATGGNPGVLTREAPAKAPNGPVGPVAGPTYTFVATEAGTYHYHSGTNPDLQIEMGLVGAIIVRPYGFAYGNGTEHANRKAYQNEATRYDRETLFLLTEMDPAVHWAVYGQVYSGQPVQIDTSTIKPSMWFINGRNSPDTQLDSYVYWLPTQPYNALPRMHPGEKMLMRMVNAGRELHPFHHHGNHALPIARDGRVLSTQGNIGAPDISAPDFTVRAVPGQTTDLIFEWTGKGIGWDIYGTAEENPHDCTPDSEGFDVQTREWCADHYKPIPVTISTDISQGAHYSGSALLGVAGKLPQGHPGLNTTGGYYHMWHSHNEKEVTTDNIFPGGMMTMLIIEPWDVDLDADTGTGEAIPPSSPPTMPNLAVLDSFDRANTNNLNNNTGVSMWEQPGTNANAVRIAGNEAVCANNPCSSGQAQTRGGESAYWSAVLGASQGAAIEFARVTANSPDFNNVSLLLKASGTLATGVYPNAIRVRYSAGGGNGTVVVETTANNGVVFTSSGVLAAGSFAAGDIMTATVNADGLVYVWKTSGTVTNLLGSVDTGVTGDGKVGMFLPPGARVDNFAGGTP